VAYGGAASGGGVAARLEEAVGVVRRPAGHDREERRVDAHVSARSLARYQGVPATQEGLRYEIDRPIFVRSRWASWRAASLAWRRGSTRETT